MRDGDLISVVIPAFNHAAYVEEAVRSVFAQTFRPIELLVVDDGSRDATAAIVRGLLGESPLARMELIEQPNAGTAAALGRGIAAARGRLLAILNSDDCWLPRRLETLAASLGDADGLAFSAVEMIGPGGEPEPEGGPWTAWHQRSLALRKGSPTLGFALLSANCSVSSSNFVFTRDLYDAVGGFSAHRFCHDWDFLMRSVLVAEPILVEQPLLRYRLHGANATQTLRAVQVDELSDALDRYLERALRPGVRNPRAPSPANWPRFFPRCLRTRPFHFERGTIADHLSPRMRRRLLGAG